jgi:hypothetical protein
LIAACSTVRTCCSALRTGSLPQPFRSPAAARLRLSEPLRHRVLVPWDVKVRKRVHLYAAGPLQGARSGGSAGGSWIAPRTPRGPQRHRDPTSPRATCSLMSSPDMMVLPPSGVARTKCRGCPVSMASIHGRDPVGCSSTRGCGPPGRTRNGGEWTRCVSAASRKSAPPKLEGGPHPHLQGAPVAPEENFLPRAFRDPDGPDQVRAFAAWHLHIATVTTPWGSGPGIACLAEVLPPFSPRYRSSRFGAPTA